MTKSGLPESIRKFIRLEKSRIRKGSFDVERQKEIIQELYKRFESKMSKKKKQDDAQVAHYEKKNYKAKTKN